MKKEIRGQWRSQIRCQEYEKVAVTLGAAAFREARLGKSTRNRQTAALVNPLSDKYMGSVKNARIGVGAATHVRSSRTKRRAVARYQKEVDLSRCCRNKELGRKLIAFAFLGSSELLTG